MSDIVHHAAFTIRVAQRMLRHRSDAPNSLFWKILPATPLDPRFWQTTPASDPYNSNESKILQIAPKKISSPSERSPFPCVPL
jgi:hypothetical protein